jgi:tetratricopeptide (TPR) repeat protein/DNA-binding winged helix-turn-helix (wHTH) protein
VSAIDDHPRMQGSQEPDFFVADWRVRPSLGQLQRDGATIDVEARSMQVLVCLAKHAPNLVSKQRLIRDVWSEAFVSEEVLSHAVWELRKAFGDEARKPRYIQTIARKGYRLLVEVTYRARLEPLVPGSQIGSYKILELVGGGSMGEVYKAQDQRLDRVVALKVLPADLARDPGARRRFLHEARAVAALDHPNVATLYEAGESADGRMFLALAFYEGETLQQKQERGPLPLPEAVAIARQIAQGLGAAHRLHIVHRDVKPSNVVILADGKVKLLDFGLAKMTGATSLTRLGSSPGTPAYKSPEQTRGDKVDPRSDLWALGVVLYEMVTGRTPFGGEYEQAVIYSILNEPPRPLDGDKAFPPELGTVIRKALEKDPAQRYATAEELDADLARIPLAPACNPLKAMELQEVRPRPLQLNRRPRRRVFLTALIATALALLLMLGVFGSWRWRQAHRWDFPPEVEMLVEQGDNVEWRGDTERTFANAEQAYRKALALAPGNPRIEARLAAMLARLNVQFPASGRKQEIQRLTKDAVKGAPDDPMSWVALAKLLLIESKPEEAEKAARKAIDLDPKFDRGYTQLGEALIAQGYKEEGFAKLRQATGIGKGFLRARLVLAAKLQDAGRYEDAAFEFRKVLDYDTDNPTAQENLGDVYLIQGRYREAIPLFRAVFEITKDSRSANGLGNAYFSLNRMDEAIAAYRMAYELNPDPTIARNLGESYEKVGQIKEAEDWYKLAITRFDQTIAIGGQPAELLYVRSFCAAKLGRYDEALRNVEEGMRLKPQKIAFLFRAAQICAMAGRREGVYAWTQKAIQAGYSRDEFGNDMAFHDYQNDPRFRAILESLRNVNATPQIPQKPL